MGSFVKALPIVAALLLALSIIAGLAGWHWYSRHGRESTESTRQAQSDGLALGEDTDDRGCLEETLLRHRKAIGPGDAVAQALFLKSCLASSEPTDGFCKDVPKTREAIASATWQARRCGESGFSDSSCRRIFGQVQAYCESDLAPRNAS